MITSTHEAFRGDRVRIVAFDTNQNDVCVQAIGKNTVRYVAESTLSADTPEELAEALRRAGKPLPQGENHES